MRNRPMPFLEMGGAKAPSPAVAITVGGLSIVAVVFFYWDMLSGGSLHGYDWESHHYHYFDWVRISLTRFHTLPLYMHDALITSNFLANAESPTLGPFVGLLYFLPTDAYIKLILVMFAAAGLAGMFFLLRDLNVCPYIATLAAVLFAFNGFFVSHLAVGHHWVMGAYLLPALFYLYRRAALGSAGALWCAAALNALTILGGQHEPFIWQNLFISLFAFLWAVQAKAFFPLWRWGLVLLGTAGLSAVKLLPMIVEFVDYNPAARIQGFPLQVVIPALLSGGQQAETTMQGVIYAYGSGWWEYAFYVGPIGALCIVLGMINARRFWPMTLLGGFFLMISVSWPPRLDWLDVWSWLQQLPVWRTQREPSRFLFLTVFAFLVVGATGAQRLWENARIRWPRVTPGIVLMLTLMAGLNLQAESRPWQHIAIGDAIPSREHVPWPLKWVWTNGADVELREFTPNRLTYRVKGKKYGTVVFPLHTSGGGELWRAVARTVPNSDDKPAVDGPVGEHDVVLTSRPVSLFAGFDVPAGEHDVVLTYRPKYFYTGMGISVMALLALCLFFLGRLRFRVRSARGRVKSAHGST